jgi:hypothetical protein
MVYGNIGLYGKCGGGENNYLSTSHIGVEKRNEDPFRANNAVMEYIERRSVIIYICNTLICIFDRVLSSEIN